MKNILFLLSFLMLFSCGGGEEIAPRDTFIKFYGGGNGSFDLTDMILRSDGEDGVVLFGNRSKVVDGITQTNFYVFLTDGNGDVDVEQEFILTNPDPLITIPQRYDIEGSRITAKNGGYLLIGTAQISNTYNGSLVTGTVPTIVWLELDVDLNPVGTWRTAGDLIQPYIGVDITGTTDGGVLIGGYTSANGTNDFYYEKIGGTGETWSRIQARPASDDQLVRVFAVSNGTYAIFGQTEARSEDGEEGFNVERTIIDNEGIIQNSLVYGNTLDTDTGLDDVPADVIKTQGGFLVVGSSTNGTITIPFVMTVDLTGAITEEVLYATSFGTFSAKGFGVTQAYSNDFMVVGQIDKFTETVGEVVTSKENEGFIIRADQDGTPLGNYQNFGLINGNDLAKRVVKNPEGKIFIGATYEFGTNLKQFVLLKMNADGELKK